MRLVAICLAEKAELTPMKHYWQPSVVDIAGALLQAVEKS
jgi:hypothetical protein